MNPRNLPSLFRLCAPVIALAILASPARVQAQPAIPTFPPQQQQPAPTDGASANEIDPDEPLPAGVSMRWEDATIDQLLEVYALLVNRAILKPITLPNIQGISLNLENVSLTRREAVQALDAYFTLNGITAVPLGEKFVTVVPSAQAEQEAAPFNTGSPEDLPEAVQYTTQVVQLQHAIPSELTPLLEQFSKAPNSIIAIDSSGTLVLRDYAVNVKRMLELIEKVDVEVKREYETELIPIKYALAGDIAQVIGSLTTSGENITVGGGATGGLGGGGAGGAFQNTGGGLNRNTGSQFNNQNLNRGGSVRTYQAAGGQTAAGRSNFQNRLRQIINTAGAGADGEVQILSETKIIADERTNSILIFAKREDLDTIKDIIAKMDVVLAQVLIEAIILQVDLGDTLDYGISYIGRGSSGNVSTIGGVNNGAPNPPVLSTNSFSPAALPGGFSYFANLGQDFSATLEALATDSRFRVLSRPTVQTSHAVPANIFSGQTRPYITGTTFSGFDSGTTRSQYQQLRIGIGLSVLPLINQEGLVVMDIQQNIQQVAGSVTIDGNEVPITAEQDASAKVAVNDRETVILGGFIQQDERKSKSGVPILKDIPLLGALFRSSSSEGRRTETMIMIRPTVLPTPELAALNARSERDRSPELRKVEEEFMFPNPANGDDTYQQELERKAGGDQ